eukprot:TRINITY_DN105534_c0_g1_i1.p1 TRINITY_DN105534_c0_g1~~TRINITY_DN105534_c0_g1_i1.p1  ORF type:complete len:254 (-),score=49.53 TRINITY_DN105534_c0_g1_i1:226-987(-)
MPPVPALSMTAPHGLGVSTPRRDPNSARQLPGSRPATGRSLVNGSSAGQAAFSANARHIIQPQVGMSAMISALGNLSAPWEQPSARKLLTPRGLPFKAESPRRYLVGRARAKDQLNMALATQDEAAQLRRLEQALEVPCVRYDEALTPRVMKAAKQINSLSRTLNSEERTRTVTQEVQPQQQRPRGPTEDSPEVEQEDEQGCDEEEAAAATRIQSLYRGKKERQETRKMVEEETKAATKIQSRYRGKAVRKGM